MSMSLTVTAIYLFIRSHSMFRILLAALGVMSATISPAFAAYVKEQLPAWEAKAAETKGKGDDLLVAILKGMFA